MKAISVRQPWAAWIFVDHPEMGRKDVENRSWTTSYRGPLAIHAGTVRDPDFTANDLAAYDTDHPAWAMRAVIGVVDLVDIRSSDHAGPGHSIWGDWEGVSHWHLANPRPLPKPIMARGKQRIFDLPADVAALVEDQLQQEGRSCE